MEAPIRYVVDASVAIQLFVEEPYSNRAHTLFEQPDFEFHVPDLIFIECANIFWKIVRRFGRSEQEAENDMFDLTQISFNSIPTRDLAGDALHLALAYSISAYDACYVALAQRLSIPLLTADEKLVQIVPAVARFLGDIDLA